MARDTVGQIERQIRIAKVEECLLRGIRSRTALAIRFGVVVHTIERDIQSIKRSWHNETIDRTGPRRVYRIRQLEYVIQQAMNGYVASCQDAQEVTAFIKDVICRDCGGLGVDKQGEWCSKCEGNGHLKHTDTQVKKRGQAGDPAFLNTAAACIKEINQLEGNYKPKQIKVKMPPGSPNAGAIVVVDAEKLIQARVLFAGAIAAPAQSVDASDWTSVSDNIEAE